jgi:hypothetical protein
MRRATQAVSPLAGLPLTCLRVAACPRRRNETRQILAKPTPRLYVTGTLLWLTSHAYNTDGISPPSFPFPVHTPYIKPGDSRLCVRPVAPPTPQVSSWGSQPARLERRSCRTHRRFCIRRIASPDPRPQCRRPPSSECRPRAPRCQRLPSSDLPCHPRRAVVPRSTQAAR